MYPKPVRSIRWAALAAAAAISCGDSGGGTVPRAAFTETACDLEIDGIPAESSVAGS